jgi:multidrug efflux pump subunit AcrA (membrane-fusion protein)
MIPRSEKPLIKRRQTFKGRGNLTFNKTEWEKNLGLLKTGSVSQTQLDQKLSSYQNAVAQVEADKAVLAKANEDLKKTRVLSPITGLLSNRYIEKGDWVSEGGKLFMVSDYSRIYLEAFLGHGSRQTGCGKVVRESGYEVGVIRIGKIFKGKLTYIQPVASQARLSDPYLPGQSGHGPTAGMLHEGRIVVKTIPACAEGPDRRFNGASPRQ